ncbi:MAG: molybdopterin molybdotransferase MoeA [Acidobacteria bacterium]|nr:molybdopterin molybdotransferase MoeA [Acidobacteriota bacterium]
MIPIAEAEKIIDREVSPLKPETVGIENAVGRVLAETIRADMDLPPFDRSQMDGFAVRAADTKHPPSHLRIIGESVAGTGFDRKMKPGEAVRIMTGARVPEGADGVQKVELTKENYGFVEILETVRHLQNINQRASEIKKGARVFGKGETVSEQMIAALAAFGCADVKVFQKPQVSIISTGSEIVPIAETPSRDQIRNSNSVMLKALAEGAGAAAGILPQVHDDFETLKNHIAAAVGLIAEVPISKFRINKGEGQAPKSKILIVTGGVSVGDYDFTKPVLRELGAEIFFEKVSLKPGKPTVFARLNDSFVFGLPGNPVSVAVTFYLFVRRAVRQMQGAKNIELKRGHAVCAEPIKGAKERDSVLPVSLSTDKKGRLTIETLRFSGSSNFIAFARADALVLVPKNSSLEKSDVAEIFFL